MYVLIKSNINISCK